MRGTRSIIGVILIVLGTVGLIVKGIEYTKQETILEVGPVEARAETTETLWIPTWAAVLVLGAGVILLVAGRSQSRA
ncbi:MAG: hypothetical protein L0271_14410 [Gemmatimonadetes bacterium]|nr:hypothetical protein [Gemmatimonadota bacterium]